MHKLKLVALLSTAILLFSCKNENTTQQAETPQQPASAPVESVAQLPALSMKDEKGNTVDLQSLKGKKLFVNLWASWCPPCRQEMPSIKELYKKSSADKATFVLISFDEDRSKALQFKQKENLEMPVYFPEGPLPELFNVPGIPTTFIFDEAGNLLKKVEGMDEYATEAYINMLNN